jgi:hypothetical protein
MLLILEPQGQRSARSLPQGQDVYGRMLDYSAQLQREGVLVAGESLHREAVRLSSREGEVSIVDGPFAEAKELIGGFFLLNCATREEALKYARACPAAAWATIEVRAIGTCYE